MAVNTLAMQSDDKYVRQAYQRRKDRVTVRKYRVTPTVREASSPAIRIRLRIRPRINKNG